MSSPGMIEQRRMALHDLLDRPLITRQSDPEAYQRIAFHEPYLKEWLRERPYWRLLGGRGVFRLERMPSHILPERGLPRLRSTTAYACLCWVLWFAESMTTSSRDWFVISELAARVTMVAEGRFTLADRQHREALVQALQLLTDLGALVLKDGDTERWISGQGQVDQEAEVMYEFSETAPRLLANFAYEGLSAVTTGDPSARLALPTGELAGPLARAWRALLLGPIFWRADDPEAFAALGAAHEQVQYELEGALGWQLQLNAEYACIWRVTTARHAAGLLLDLYPDPSVPSEERTTRYLYHPILLLLGRLQEGVAQGSYQVDDLGAVLISDGDLNDLLSDLRSNYRKSWGTGLGALSEADLAAEVFREMRRIGLLRGPDRAGKCYILPPAAQLRGTYPAQAPTPTRSSEGKKQLQLFDVFTKEDP